MESAFSSDFAGVRVHTGPAAHDAALAMGAREPVAEDHTSSAGSNPLWQALSMRSVASLTTDGADAEPPLRVQPKLTVSAAGDPLEQEADRVAASAAPGEHVNAAATPVRVVSRVAVPSGRAGTSTPLDARIASPSGGRPLPDAVRRDMETTFDADFSAVRLHDTQRDRADAESIGARAFTHKHHIWLGRNGLADDRGLLAHELTHVIQQGTDVRRTTTGRTGTGRTGTRPEATVGSAPDVQGAWYNIGIPGTDYEFDPSWSGIKTAAGLAKDAAADVGHGIGAAAEKVWDVGKVLWQIAKVLYNGAVHALVMLIETPGKALEYIKDFVAGLVAKAPGKLQEVLAEYLAPRLGGPADTTASAEVSIQRQEELATATERIPETSWQAVTRHLGVRLRYLKDNWWEVIKDAALEILVPGVALYRHFPTMIKELGQAFTQLKEGNYSQSFDHLLATAREAMAIVSSFLAQVSIAAFIIGSIIGTPIVGVAALETIGLAVIATDVSIQLLSLGQSVDNLDRPRSPEQHESDYGLIADSSISIAILLALLALGAITSVAVKALLRRFPGLAAAVESARARVRARLGRGAKVPESPKPRARSRGVTASGVGEEFTVEEHPAGREPVIEKRPGTARPTSPASTAQQPATTIPPQSARGSTVEDIASVQDEATQGTGRGGRSPSDPEELNAPPDSPSVNEEDVEQMSPRYAGDRFDAAMTEEDLALVAQELFPQYAYDPATRGRLIFKGGKPTGRRSSGSTVPDLYLRGRRARAGNPRLAPISLEAKNYFLGDEALYEDFLDATVKQARQRAAALPKSAQQHVVIDLRGQNPSVGFIDRLRADLVKRSGGVLRADRIHFLTTGTP